MQFIDLKAQQARIKDKIDSRIQDVLKHGKYIMGPEVAELEKELADYVGAKHALSCASGTDALLLALMAYNIGPGDAIITCPFTFIATAEVISLLGATPVFVDMDSKSYNLDPSKLEAVISETKKSDLNLKGIIGVDMFGLPADYDAINAIAKEHGLFVIEDAAQSFGGEYKGRKACSLADITCTSFFPAKPLGCYGDGGMCFSNDDQVVDIMKSIRVHGQGSDKYNNVRIGINGRLDTLQAAILLEKFGIFPEEIQLRQKVTAVYKELFDSIGGGVVSPPQVTEGYLSAWAQYSIQAKDEEHRSDLQAKLKEAGIPTAIYYPKPLHLQDAFSNLNYKAGDFPVCEAISKRIFAIPMHPYLTREQQETIVKAIAE
jgi:UDP-2-acetamido-2-deoxy-ribo-hexuluronate aminotransferase